MSLFHLCIWKWTWCLSVFSSAWIQETSGYLGGELFCRRIGQAQQLSAKIVQSTRPRCAFHCVSDDDCSSFTYRPSNNTCLLHTYNQSSLLTLAVDDQSEWHSPHNCIILSKLIGLTCLNVLQQVRVQEICLRYCIQLMAHRAFIVSMMGWPKKTCGHFFTMDTN